MKRGDAFAVLWLMHPDHEQRGPVAERIERYRRIGEDELEIEVVPHSVAAYLAGARIRVNGEQFDEIAIQNFGIGARSAKWFLVHFSESSAP